MSRPHRDHREKHSRWGEQQEQKSDGQKFGPKNMSHRNYTAVCSYVCNIITPVSHDFCCLLQAHAGGPHLGNPPKVSAFIVSSKLHKTHSRVQPNSFSKWTGILNCNLGCALLEHACCVCFCSGSVPTVFHLNKTASD